MDMHICFFDFLYPSRWIRIDRLRKEELRQDFRFFRVDRIWLWRPRRNSSPSLRKKLVNPENPEILSKNLLSQSVFSCHLVIKAS
jgi:hypothetical protein